MEFVLGEIFECSEGGECSQIINNVCGRMRKERIRKIIFGVFFSHQYFVEFYTD